MATLADGSEAIVQRRGVTSEEETDPKREPSSEAKKEDSSTGCWPLSRLKANGDRPKSRRPPSNKWLQQQIPACRPVFTAKYVFALFMVIGVIFLALGITFVAVTVQLRDLEVEYTNCGPLPTDDIESFTCEDHLREISNISNSDRRNVSDCHCTLTFEVKETIRYPWKFYYGLDNYYQNHRRYLNSWDPAQLRGDNFHHPDSICRPLVRSRDEPDEGRRPIVPCGVIANSWFNDYPVERFDGHKFIFITELSWLGGRNLFLGIAYIITAVVCVVTGIVLLIIHLFFSKWKTSDPNYLKREY